jgi:hypothetical protein
MNNWVVLAISTIAVVGYFRWKRERKPHRNSDGGTGGDFSASDFSWGPGHHPGAGGDFGGHHGASGDFGGGDSGGGDGGGGGD